MDDASSDASSSFLAVEEASVDFPRLSNKDLKLLWQDPSVSELERAIACLANQNCCHAVHNLHSFQQVSFSFRLFRRIECVACRGRLQTVTVWASDDSSKQVVQCLACGAWAHRKCAGACRDACTVNGAFLSDDDEVDDENDDDEVVVPTWTPQGPPQHWTHSRTFVPPPPSPTRIQRAPERQTVAKDTSEAAEEPASKQPEQAVVATSLHPAQHPFASVSRALQENIAAHLDRLKEELVVVPRNNNNQEEEEKKDGHEQEQQEQSQSPTHALNDVFKKHGSAAVVAGSVVGGLAGLALAGPAGALAAFEGAGALGVLLEGSVTVGVFVASIATGGVTAKHIQSHVERRVLTMGEEGVARKVLLVRPNIQIDPEWNKICAQAKRSHHTVSPAAALRFLQPTTTKQRDFDIVHVHEDEIPTTDKVLLLVSRILNDRTSLPGHVYRSLIQAFEDRQLRANTDDDDPTAVSPRARRDDAHAVIKHVTATLLEVQPEFASSPAMTELTATTVESLVFGHLYQAVFEECQAETREAETALQAKIAAFQATRKEQHHEQSLSQPALQALSMLPESHAAVPKLDDCVQFLEILATAGNDNGADFLLARVCQHALVVPGLQAQVTFMEEFARDECLLRGRQGYALVTLQAAVHFLNQTSDLQDLFQSENQVDTTDDDEEEEEDAVRVASPTDPTPKEAGTTDDEEEEDAVRVAPPTTSTR